MRKNNIYLIVILTLLSVICVSTLFAEKETIKTQIINSFNQELNSRVVFNSGFEPNLGQIGDYKGEKVYDVLFFCKEKDFSLYIRENGITFVIYEKPNFGFNEIISNEQKGILENSNIKLNYARIDIELINGYIRKDKIVYENELTGYTNYYLSHCPEGIVGVKSYSIVKVKEIYPGINWIFKYDESGKLHHEFEVMPGADLNKLRLMVKWADIEITDGGTRLILSTPIGKICDGTIESYSDNKKIDIRYKAEGKIISYEVDGWNGNDKLIIDPPLMLLWATYYGGSDYEYSSFNSIATDVNGNIFICGYSHSSNFPTQDAGGGAYYQGTYAGGLYDVVILKFNNNGVRQWATFYGGLQSDRGFAIVSDLSNNIFVTGATTSSNFPLYNPGGGAYYQETKGTGADAFILKFANNGVRLWATYYGGNGTDEGYSVKSDGSGNIFLCGNTYSTDFPLMPGSNTYFQETYGGFGDAFIMKFTNSGVRNWATYYGGNDIDYGNSVEIDELGNLYVCGCTYSTNFPLKDTGIAFYQGNIGGSCDAFILGFSNNCTRKWATYYGGASQDEAFSLATDADENLYVTGYTNSTNFSTLNPFGGAYYQANNGGEQDAFIIKFNYYGIRQWATYYGGTSMDKAYSVKTDVNKNVYLCGFTYSLNFPTKNPGGGAFFQGTNLGVEDCFFIRFNNSCVRQWATFYGGSNGDYATALTTDANSNLFITGYTFSNGLLTYNPGGGAYYQVNNAGQQDFIILKFQGGTIGIQQIGSEIPSNYILNQNYPNPFNATTNIKFSLPEAQDVKLTVFDLLGREVATLVNERLQAGTYSVDFDASNLTSGVYIYRLETSNYIETKKMILLK